MQVFEDLFQAEQFHPGKLNARVFQFFRQVR